MNDLSHALLRLRTQVRQLSDAVDRRRPSVDVADDIQDLLTTTAPRIEVLIQRLREN